MAQAIKFKNFTSEEFSWKWNGNEYKFPAGMEIFMNEDEAYHFAKHLVDREMNRTNTPTNNMSARKPLEAQCFPTDEVVTPLVALNINETAKKSKKAEKKVEPEFVELNKE